jgi:D-amino peptidase
MCGSGLPRGWGLDAGFDCLLQVSMHAMNRTMDGTLCHSQNHLSDARYWYAGREMGEMEQFAMVAAQFGAPWVMTSGDFAACRESEQFVPGIVTVPVKYGLSRQSARLLSPEKTRETIREGARQAMSLVGKIKPLDLQFPLQAKVETLVEPLPDSASWDEINAAPHQSHEWACETALNVYG